MSGQMPLSALLRDARRRGAHNIHIGLKARRRPCLARARTASAFFGQARPLLGLCSSRVPSAPFSRPFTGFFSLARSLSVLLACTARRISLLAFLFFPLARSFSCAHSAPTSLLRFARAQAFGPGGHVRRPRDGVRESYLWRKARAD
eukprot:4928405-Pleurochrysis_carterae.AAC.2